MIGLGVAADLAGQARVFLSEECSCISDKIMPPTAPLTMSGLDSLQRAIAAAPDEPPPPIPADRCPECLAVKSIASFFCRRCQKKWAARARRATLPVNWRRFKGMACATCHEPGTARGGSGLCRRCYERAWNRKWARARRLKVVCQALSGMGFNELLSGLGEKSPNEATLNAVRLLFVAVAEGRAWIARSPWPARRGGWGKASGEPSGCGPEEGGSIPPPHSNVSRGTALSAGQKEASRA